MEISFPLQQLGCPVLFVCMPSILAPLRPPKDRSTALSRATGLPWRPHPGRSWTAQPPRWPGSVRLEHPASPGTATPQQQRPQRPPRLRLGFVPRGRVLLLELLLLQGGMSPKVV
jgi:hypothetical protein